MKAIEVKNLRRIYYTKQDLLRHKRKPVVAVDDLNFEVEQGELFGILGPNGAGKTTTIKMLTTLLLPTDGEVYILSHNVVHQTEYVRQRIGFLLGGERGLYWRLSGYDNLVYFANLYHMQPSVQKKRIPALLETVGLEDHATKKVEAYSRGMKQRLHIARALLHDPEVIFLDEPTIGLDPIGARELRQIVRNLQDAKKTIVLTTHYMFEADELCQRIAVINKGKIIALDTPGGLKNQVQDLAIIEIEAFNIPPEAVEKVRTLEEVHALNLEERESRQVLCIHSPSGAALVVPCVSIFRDMGLIIENISIREPTLEDAYIRLVGGEK